MKLITFIAGILLFMAGSFVASAQIPKNPNKTNKKGLRQGKWTILFDKNWSPVDQAAQAEFYRVISYKDDQPVGVVRDFYKTGKPQFAATMKADRPQEVLDGLVTWFTIDGKKEAEAEYDNGQPKKVTTFDANEIAITDSVSVLTQKGVSAYQSKQIPNALTFFLNAKLRAKYEFGTVSRPYLDVLYFLGTLHFNTNNFQQAELCYTEASDIYLKALGAEHPNYASSQADLGRLYNYTGEYKKAEIHYATALDIYRKKLDPDHPDFLETLTSLGGVYKHLGEFNKAVPLLQEGIDGIVKKKGKMNSEYIKALNLLAFVHSDKGDRTIAAQYYVELKAITEQVLGKENTTYTAINNNLAQIYRDDGYFAKAVPLIEENLTIIEKQGGKQEPEYATALNNLARLYSDMGAFRKAEPMYQESIQIIEKTIGKNNPKYGSALGNMAEFYSQISQYAKAEALLKESVAVQERVSGKGSLEYAFSLNNLAILYYETGEYTKAEPLLLESKDIHVNSYGKLHKACATSFNNLGSLYSDMGDFNRAEIFYKEAAEITRQVEGEEHPSYGVYMNNLGNLYQEKGDTALAMHYTKLSANINLKVYGHDHPVYAVSLGNIGYGYSMQGNYALAEKYLRESLTIREKILGKENPEYAMSVNNLGGMYSEAGDYKKAEPYYLEAKGIRERTLGKEHPSYSNSVSLLAGLYEKMGDYTRAEPLHLETISKIQGQIVKNFPALSEREKASFYSSKQVYFRNFESFALTRHQQNPQILNDWYNLQLATKALLLNKSNKMRQRILQSNDNELIALFNQWQAKKDFLAKVYQMGAEEKKRKEISESGLEEEANTLEKQLSQKSELFASSADNRAVSWREVQAKLGKGEAAIELIRTERKKDKVRTPVYVALIIKPDTKKNPEIIVLENGAELEARYSKYYRNAIRQKIKDEISYNQYWKPLSASLKGTTKVYFSADGVYNQLSLNTLYNPETKKHLIDELEVQLVTSTKDLLTLSKTALIQVKDATLFGFPNYNNTSATSPDSTRSWKPTMSLKVSTLKSDTAQRFFNGENITELPGTKVEVENIQALLKQKGIALKQFIFDEATEAQIKSLSNPHVLHIATHGFFLSDLPTSTSDDRSFAGMNTKKIAENPLLRSGLLFAGVKNAFTLGTSEGEDGVLTAYEAMSLDLDQTNLVVMSACETGLGVTANGEGVYGLQRAFQVAGAKSVLMSLWTVSDEATQKLMTQFYENWLGGKSLREAFRMAQLSLREKYPEPFYWGAFVLVGN